MRLFEKYYSELKKLIHPSMFDDIVFVDITPSAKWFLMESDKEYWRYRDDFPCVLPPASLTWMEFDYPPFVRSSEALVYNTTTRAVGALIFTMEIPEKDRKDMLLNDGIIDAFNYMLRRNKVHAGLGEKNDLRKATIDNYMDKGVTCRWMIFWQLFGEPLNAREILPFVTYGFYLDENGQILGDLGVGNLSLPHNVSPPPEGGFSDTLPFLFALSLTHCRNVEIVEREIPAAVAKKRKEKGVPTLKFKQLVIKPIGGKQTTSAAATKNGMMPLGFTRAHFKTYTEDRKLFGRWSGTFWWHQHARGNNSHGEIIKTYKVKTGETHVVQNNQR